MTKRIKEFGIPETKLMGLMYHGFPRGVGHTHTEINGVLNNPKAILILNDARQAKGLNLPGKQWMTVDDIPNSLRGLQRPIVIDHYALSRLVSEHNNEIMLAFDKWNKEPKDD